jgi:hypothetical protein
MTKYAIYLHRAEIYVDKILNVEHCYNIWNPEVGRPAGSLERLYL